MTDKVQKIRDEVERLKSQLIRGACSSYIEMETCCKEEAYNEVLALLDSFQEEPKPKFNKGDKIQSVGKSTGHIYTSTIKEIQDDCYVLDDDKVLTFNMQDSWELVKEPVSKEFEKKFISFVNATHDNNGSYSLHDFAQRLYNIAKEELKEPVSEELEKSAKKYVVKEAAKDISGNWTTNDILNAFNADAQWQKTKEEPVSVKNKLKALSDGKQHLGWIDDAMALEMGEDLVKEVEGYIDTNGFDGLDSVEAVKSIACHFVNWQKTKDESTTEDLGEYVNELSKQFPEVSFAKLSRIAVRVAKWQKQQEYTCYEEAFEDGAAWKYEQMMKGSIDAKIGSFTNGTIYDADFNIDSNLKDDDKVKIIVIKEDWRQ